MGSKSERSQRRYRSLLKDQCKLDALGFNKASTSQSPTHGTAINDGNADLGEDVTLLPNMKEEPAPETIPSSNMPMCPAPQLIDDDVIIRQETPDPPALNFDRDVAIRQESMTPPPLSFEGDNVESGDGVCVRQESMTPPPLFFLNTRKRKATRHYQVFEQLPRERRGGYRNSRSLLKDEIVRTASRTWLTEQPIGSITPTKFMHALNTTILPTLGMLPNKPLCERTARRWLVKLGWMRTVLRKGVYMDGHERADVVEYREKVFLPKMKEFERRMARYEGPDLKRVEPDLRPGEKELIAEFQDKSCCAGNDYQASAWYASTSFSSHLVRNL